DDKLQDVLGHFKKDFEGVVSAESLGAKYGIYGSFLPTYRRSPVGSQSKSPPRVQNNITPQSPNTLQMEVGHHKSLAPANVSYSIKQGSASTGSASSFPYKPLPQNDLSRKNGRKKSIKSLDLCATKSEVRDQKTLKVRIKVGSDNLSVKKNAAIYSGLGLDGSPTSSLDDSPMDNEGLSCRLSFDGFESPTQIIQMMTSSLLLGGCFLSPLPDDLMCLSERPKHTQDILTETSSKAELKNSVTGHPTFPIKDKTSSVENNMKLLDKKGLSLQDKGDGKDNNIGFGSQLKETDIDAVSCDELVSKALKLPLLSNAHSDVRCSPTASLKQTVFSDTSEREPLEPVFVHVSLSEKSTGKVSYAANNSNSKAAEVRNNMVTDSEKVGDDKFKTVDGTTNFSTGASNLKKASKNGLKDPVNQGTNKFTSRDDAMAVSCGNGQFSFGDEKRPKKSQARGFATGKIAMEINEDSAPLLKDMKYTDAEKTACRIEVQKDSKIGMGQYVDFFGEMNEEEGDVMDSPDVPSGEMLKTSEVVDKTSFVYENNSKERTSSLDTRKGTTFGEKLKGHSTDAPVPENGRPIFETAPTSNEANVDWVGCDKCQKWRVFPPGCKPDNLPDKWDCSMMTWLPDMNRCSASEEETNNFHVPPPGMTSADIMNSGRITSKVRKPSKSSFQNSPKKPPSSIKKQFSAKEPYHMNGLDLEQQAKSGDTYPDSGQHKKIEKHRMDCYSDGGHAKNPKIKSKRESDQDFSRTSKKSKTRSMQSGDNGVAAHDQGFETLGVSSGYGLGAGTSGKDQVSDLEFFASQNSKDDINSIRPDYFGKSKFQVEDLPVVGSMHVSKSGSGNKKRKGDNFKDPPNSTPSSGKLRDDNEKSSRKRHRISKSEGKDSSASKRNGKADKKTKNVSQHRLVSNESVQKDSVGANPVMAATSSSSKISGSLKVKSKFQEIKGSPVESVSSSPLRIPNQDNIISGCKVTVGNDDVQEATKVATDSPTRCSAVDYDGNDDQSGAILNDKIATGTLHGSSNLIGVQDKSIGDLQLTNGNSRVENLNLDNGFPSETQVSHRCVNETAARGELRLDANISNSGKSCKDSPSLSNDKNQTLKSNSGKSKVKMSDSYENSLNHTIAHEERELDRKVKVDEKCGSSADKNMNCTILSNKEPSFPKSEGKPEFDERRFSKKFDVDKSEDLVPISAKEKSRHMLRSDGEKKEALDNLQPKQGIKASTSASDARLDALPREPRLNKKADSQNGTHILSKQTISNGHRNKNQDAPSPLRRDSSSQAASSAIKEATNLKHLADRLKSSSPTESIAMYFEAALKFLHGASLLESGKAENIKHADIAQSKQIYSSTAKLCQFCAHEFEKMKDMATAALAYKCVEVAYMRVIYNSHITASRDRHELQAALQMVPPGESPSSSASDIDNLNNNANGDKAAQARSGGSPQLAANLVIAAKNRPNFSRLLSFAQDVNSAMEASRKSRIAFAAANVSMSRADLKEGGITSIKRALDFNFYDVDGLLRLVRLAKETISR
uniref:CW-type domain-containing protein n=2 Tax=Chenopodium quinoa TaxID=63459 RepID=A0A803MPJ7_CHEQI